MKTRISILAFWVVLFGCVNASAQLVGRECPYVGHSQDLICLIPELTQTGQTANLGGFNSTIAQVLGQLPLAVPNSGFVLGFKNGIPVDLTENLGSVLTERGNTIGKNKFFLGFTFQRFVFSTVDGNKLSDLPVFGQDSTGVYNYSHESLHANLDQYTAFAAFGLTDRVDVSLSLPFQRISVSGARTDAQSWAANGASLGAPTSLYAPGSASGVGDLLVNAKASILPGEGKSRLAAGMEFRFATGNAYNLLGTGAYGVKPFFVFSQLAGRFTPHINVGYQWNGTTILRLNPAGGDLRLPNSIDYSGGTDIGLVKRRLSLVVDLVGQRFFNAPRVLAPVPTSTVFPSLPCAGSTPSCTTGLTTVRVSTGDYFVDNLSLGLKLNPSKSLIISANALIRLDTPGLRPDRFVPLVGISYLFGK